MSKQYLNIYIINSNYKKEFEDLRKDWSMYFNIKVTYCSLKELEELSNKKKVDILIRAIENEDEKINTRLYKSIRDVNNSSRIIYFVTNKISSEYLVKLYKNHVDEIISFDNSYGVKKWRTISILRRKWDTYSKNNVLFHESLIMDLENLKFSKNGEQINLSIKEFKLLKILIRNSGDFISKSRLTELIWGEKYHDTTRVFDQVFHKVKKKVGSKYFEVSRREGIKII